MSEQPGVPDWLARVDTSLFSFHDGVASRAIDSVQNAFGVSLPNTYKEFLSFTNGAEIALENDGQFITRFLPVAPRVMGELTLSLLNSARGNSPLFAIGILRADEFGFLFSDLEVESEDCRVFEFIDDQGEICMLARSFKELVADMSCTRPNQEYTPSFLQESGPVSWYIDEPVEHSRPDSIRWWQFWKRG